jgi:hypothetical protein
MDDFLDRLLAIVDVPPPPLFLNRDIMMLPNENAATDADDADDNLPNMATSCKAIISVGWEDNILIRVARLLYHSLTATVLLCLCGYDVRCRSFERAKSFERAISISNGGNNSM